MKKKTTSTGTLKLEKTIIGSLNQQQQANVYGGADKTKTQTDIPPKLPPPPPSGADCTSFIPQR